MDPDLKALIERCQGDPERIVGDRYLLLEHVAEGTFGEVHRAWDPQQRREVAIKMLMRLDLEAQERFKREAKVGRQLDHPRIVGSLDRGRHEGRPYIVMPFVRGHSLQRYGAGGSMVPKRAAKVLRDVALATQFAHEQGVIHRDLKPANVMVDDEFGGLVTDFGLARVTYGNESKLTVTGALVGSPLYMAPEQSGGDYTPSGDIYAIGATLYYGLTGHAPLSATSLDDYLDMLASEYPPAPSSHRPGLPADLDTICFKCLEKDPAKRYASAREVAADLDRWLKGEPILAQPPRSGTSAARWLHRHRLELVLGGLALAAVVLTAVALVAVNG